VIDVDREPIAEFEHATVWYHERAAVAPIDDPDRPDESRPSPTRHEGPVQIYDSWIRLGGPMPHWVPRESVVGVSER
jgi:hypothetical protein